VEINGTRCETCAAGKVKAGTFHVSTANCSACVPGSFSAGSGETACASCEEGTFSEASASTACQYCAAGTYSAAKSKNCSACHPNAASPVGAKADECVCSVNYQGDGIETCTECSADIRNPCECNRNTYGNPRNKGGCTRCPANAYSPAGSTSSEQCQCAAGYWRSQEYDYMTYTETYQCNACPANSMSAPESIYEQACKCNPGFFAV